MRREWRVLVAVVTLAGVVALGAAAASGSGSGGSGTPTPGSIAAGPRAPSRAVVAAPVPISAVAAVGTTVADMERSLGFYTGVLGFERVTDVEVTGSDWERLEGVFGLRMRVVRLRLGDETIELTEYLTPRGRRVPPDSRSHDRWFQHLAIVVSDMDRAAYEFGTLALRLNERLYDPALRAKVLMMFAWSISLWRMPLEASFPHTREALRLGHETGLFVDAAWALFNEIWFALLTAPDLASFRRVYAANVEYSERTKMRHIADAKRVLLQWGRALEGLTEHPLSLTGAGFDQEAYRTTYQGQRLFEMFHVVVKLGLLYAFGEPRAAVEAARRAEAVIRNDFSGTIWDELRVFYHALALGLTAALEEVERTQILAALARTAGIIEGPKGAARLLKMHPNTLRSRMEKLGVKRPRPDVS